ncbi:MAG: Holliday junction branch migration protein RuvA [Hyphomicrobiales bacterium]
MIGKLKGLIDSIGDDWVIVDVGGVGYLVQCSGTTLGGLPGKGEAVALAIETYVREDQIRLFGFASDMERDWFKLLLTVQGVGTKVALAILSTLKPSALMTAVAMQDKAQISKAPGVGPKVAQRIVTELKDKFPALTPADAGLAAVQANMEAPSATAVSDAVSALVNLGYAQTQAGAAVAAALRQTGEDAAAEQIIRHALKELAR